MSKHLPADGAAVSASLGFDNASQALRNACERLGKAEVSRRLPVQRKTLDRWIEGSTASPPFIIRAIRDLLNEEITADVNAKPADFTFIDLFAGIGGTRLGFEGAGGRCVFTSEYDRFCNETYRANFHSSHEITGDITKITRSEDVSIKEAIPDHDVLVAGFPCQPFSIAGVSKKNALGRAHGFECKTQGTLFFDICKILDEKRPLAFMLENVRNLRSHDKGQTFAVIMEALRDLGYFVPEPRIIDARSWRPQHRERIFIVGFKKPTAFSMDQIEVPDAAPTLASVLHKTDGSERPDGEYLLGPKPRVNPKYVLTAHLWQYLQDYRAKHEAAGNGFGFGLVTPKSVARTLSARYYKDGSEILISRGSNKIPRRLTPRECARLMGFPDTYSIPVSDTQAYKQFGNSVVVPVIESVAKAMRNHLLPLKAAVDQPQAAMVV